MASTPTVDRSLIKSAPTNEIGANVQGMGPAPWASLFDATEFVPELVWPASVWTFDRMRSDTQLAGLYAGCTLPIRRYKWSLDPNGARPEIVQALATELNLDIRDQPAINRRRMQKRFSWEKHLSHLLLALIYGHMFFEQVGYIGADGFWHLKKLAPRMPHYLGQINVAPDGGLVSIKQNIGVPGNPTPEIPVDRLVAYVWEQEGANWFGRSLFRECFKNWLIKDRLLRVDAINHERAGGIPYIEAPSGASWDEIQALNQFASDFRVGESSGGAVPAGAKLALASAGGSDVVKSIQYHDEAMARRFLMMFIQLGQTHTGSRALGRTFVEFFSLSQEVIANWAADVTNEHVLEDWVDWNYGPNEEQVPLIVYEKQEDPKFAGTELAALITSGAITVDEDLDNAIRDELGLPERMEGDPPPTGPTKPALGAAAVRVLKRRARAELEAGPGAPSLPADAPSVPVNYEGGS